MSMKKELVDNRDRKVAKFEFDCLDGGTAEVDLRCCLESAVILEYVQRGFTGDVPIKIPKNIIKLVNEFCVKRWESVKNNLTTYDDDRHALQDSDFAFVSKQPLTILFWLLQAARRLKMKNLLNVVCAVISKRLDSNPDDLHRFCNMSGFTQKAFEEAVEWMIIRGVWGYQQFSK